MKPDNEINARLAANLRGVRKARGLSLEALAKLSGVSRSMLSQIERGASSPTVSTLWNLTRALQVELTEIIGGELDPPGGIEEILRAEETPTIDDAGEGCVIRILSGREQAGRHEIYDIAFEAGGALESAAHWPGCREALTVLSGALLVISGEEEARLAVGDTARYAADRVHAIRAPEAARALLVVYTPNESVK